MKSISTSDVDVTTAVLDELFAHTPPHNVSFRLWEGTSWPDETPRAATLVLNHPGALRQMFESGTEKALAEAYLRGDFDVLGDMEAAFEIDDLLTAGSGWKRIVALIYLLRKLPAGRRNEAARRTRFGRLKRRHSLERDQQAIAFHYDISNDFYGLWLDHRMVYSCAYFENTEADIDAAQAAKLDYLCRKLRLRSGQTVLDIGCGWGGFALYAARHYGVAVTGVTLSRRQAEFAVARAAAANLQGRVNIRRMDYRSLPEGECFDAVVSVGMAEHVGAANLPAYFQAALRFLKPGGVFLNHAIGDGFRSRPNQGPSFIDEYVFPDGDIPPIQTTVTAAADAGFEIRDVENLREHYALTLRHWVRRLQARYQDALAFVDETTYRIWRLYMAGSAYGFARGRLAVYQTLLAKPDGSGNAGLPLTRRDWYV